MNMIKNTLVLILASMMMFSCGKTGKNEQNEHIHSPDQTMSDELHDHGNAETSNDNDNATQAYINLKNALVDTDAVAASEAAKNLAAIFHTSEFHEEATLADQIAASTDVEEQRSTFKTLSEKVYLLASGQKIEFSTLYKQYCPMAFNDQGAYWLSESKEIFNPYFGDKMLKCGRVEETLAKK